MMPTGTLKMVVVVVVVVVVIHAIAILYDLRRAIVGSVRWCTVAPNKGPTERGRARMFVLFLKEIQFTDQIVKLFDRLLVDAVCCIAIQKQLSGGFVYFFVCCSSPIH
uniref:Putative secreted protein n=1 Tax=Anopheles darlingi TaxID=43151 RepID=A0A2M4D303_ANODA